MTTSYRTNYSNGYVVEYKVDGPPCSSWLLLPAENLWSEGMRGFLYTVALAYLFMGIAIASDMFMCSIEVITSKKRKVVLWDEERQEKVEREVLLWNETVANLTLMALGSSAPEILLATGEMVGDLDDREPRDALGTFTIIGSAAFNLLIITAVCVMSVPTGEVKTIKELGVFIVTSIWSIWAYVWMLIVVQYISPGQIDPWEAWVTLGYLPLFVFMSYLTDRGCCCAKRKVEGVDSEEDQEASLEHSLPYHRQLLRCLGCLSVRSLNQRSASVPVRVVGHQHQHFTRTVPKELRVLEAEKAHRMSTAASDSQEFLPPGQSRPSIQTPHAAGLGGFASMRRRRTQASFCKHISFDKIQEEAQQAATNNEMSIGVKKTLKEPETTVVARARFRHAAVSALMGSAGLSRKHERRNRMADVVAKVQKINDAIKQGKAPEVVRKMLRKPSLTPSHCFEVYSTWSPTLTGDLLGKFTFASDRYAVLESAGTLEIDVLFHRQLQSVHLMKSMTSDKGSPTKNGQATPVSTSGVTPKVVGAVSVDYETREGSAKSGKDFKNTQGTLTFDENEYRKVITVPIINDNQYEADVDFYILLKNPAGGGGLGDPSIARVTIVDDDDPGEFLFEEPHYHADMKSGKVTVRVIREHGFDGKVTLEYSTIDGTAVGGNSLGTAVDYIECHGELVFEHGETTKTITVDIHKNSAQGPKNFIITIRNPSTGAKIGIRSAVVVHLNKDELMERVGEVLEDDGEEEITWGGQFAQAMTVAPEKDEEGNEVLPKWHHYLMHFISFFWKVFCALIPPTSIGGAWPSFFVSLVFIGAMTTLVEQVGKLLGCVVGLENSVTGITIIALGTSLPDTFASRTAALQDEHADAAIGNITGSNSVNVFLGLGLPWVIKTIHALIYGYTFKVKTDNLAQSVTIFGTAGTICIVCLLLRRKFVGGELGGSALGKYSMAIFVVSLWSVYVVVISLHASKLLHLPEF
ncbi:sodium/calcium exchanger 2-like isoform X3 [Littorina saxatilis]|uniref:sodium/calcium exchanger 2-like isoform X3 n=1 Tax=Littorina saxatilis TaxID=31220 RepID=UPI0038B49779